MSTFKELISSKTRLKADARKLAVEELEKVIKSLQEVLEGEKAKQEKREIAAREANIKKINALLVDSGLSASDLSKADSGKKTKAKTKTKTKTQTKTKAKTKTAAKRKAGKKTAPVKPKYRLLVDGEEYLWSGRGRTPRVFKEYFEAGNSKESCLI